MNDPDIMLNYLETLLKESNFTRAAEHLYISQPYLTQLIKRVEKKLGTTIINRDKVPFTLTESGQIYYQYLEKHFRPAPPAVQRPGALQQPTGRSHPDRHSGKPGHLPLA